MRTKKVGGMLRTLQKALTKRTYGSRKTGSIADDVGTWKGDPYVAPPTRKPPSFTVPPPPESPAPSNPGSTSPTPPRAESPTALEKLRGRKSVVPAGILSATASQNVPYFSTNSSYPLTRGKGRKHRGTRRRKTHRRRR
jgi:hypothetical protein